MVMAQLDPQPMVRKLKVETSTTSSTASSTSDSPTYGNGGGGAVHPPVPNIRAYQLDGYKPSISKSRLASPRLYAESGPFADHGESHASTPPIAVPTSPSREFDSLQAENHSQSSGSYFQPSSLNDSAHTRRPSISFDPHVTLDNGCVHALDEPLPKPERSAADVRPRGRSILEILSTHSAPLPPAGAHSGSEQMPYDTITRELVTPRDRLQRPDDDKILQRHQGQSHYPLLQSTVDELDRNSGMPGRQRMPSLSSDITASPVIEEVPTPLPGSQEYSLSPLSVSSPLGHPQSLNETSAWPTAPRSPRLSASQRSFSHSLDNRRTARQRWRTNSERSMSGNSTSPAGKYLANWVPGARPVPAEPDDEGQLVHEYVIGKQIGYGGYSVVKEAFTFENGVRVRHAVKIVRKRVANKDERENEQLQAEFEHEYSIWRWLKHPHILPLIKVVDTPFATFCFTKLNTTGTLFDLMRLNRKGLNVDLAKRYCFQLASAIRYLHEDVRVIHRDIKLENCLLDTSGPNAAAEGGNILLCDFGMAEFITSEGTSEIRNGAPYQYERELLHQHKTIGPSDTSTSIVGSLQYAAPELVEGSSGPFTTAVDIWAFGVVVFVLLVGGLPFQHTFLPRVQQMILEGDWNEQLVRSAKGVQGEEQDVIDLLKGCLHRQLDSRWKIGQVLTSRWLEGYKEKDDGESGGNWKA